MSAVFNLPARTLHTIPPFPEASRTFISPTPYYKTMPFRDGESHTRIDRQGVTFCQKTYTVIRNHIRRGYDEQESL